MKTQLKLANSPAPPRSPERIALAAAIEKRDVALQKVAAIQVALRTNFESILNARSTIEKANEAIAESKSNAARHLTDQALGTAGTPPLSLKDGRVAAQDAEDALEAALAARTALEKSVEPAKHQITYAQMNVDARIREVVTAVTAKLSTDFITLLREYLNLRGAITFLDVNRMLPEGHKSWRAEYERLELQAEPKWRATVAALSTDPDAPLPTA